VAVAANGTIYAASVGNKSHNPLPPLCPCKGSFPHITIVQRRGGIAGGGKHSAALPKAARFTR